MRQYQEDTNIPHEEGLPGLRKGLQSQKEKYVSTDNIIGLAKVVLKDNIFTFCRKTLKQKRRTATGNKCAALSSILFMAELEEEVIKESKYQLYLWWRYTEDIILVQEHGENKLKSFNDKINTVHHFTNF